MRRVLPRGLTPQHLTGEWRPVRVSAQTSLTFRLAEVVSWGNSPVADWSRGRGRDLAGPRYSVSLQLGAQSVLAVD